MLAVLVHALRSAPALAGLVRDVIRVRIVLDANSVHDELSFRLRRQSSIARTDLHEMIDAGVVEAFVPCFLDAEIAEHAKEIGDRFGKTAADVWAAYLEFRPRLRPYDPIEADDPIAAGIDPDDVVYKRVFEELGLDAVLTRDKHFSEMNVPSVKRLPRALRDYARSSSVSIGIGCGSGLVLVLGFGSLTCAYTVVDGFLSAIERLPDWAKLLLAVSIAALIIHPASREQLMEQWNRLRERMLSLAPTLYPFLTDIAVAHATASDHAKRLSAELQQVLPKTHPKTAIQLIRLIFLTSHAPISIRDITAQMRSEGFTDGDESLACVIERKLRASSQFIEASPSKWILRDRSSGYEATAASMPTSPTPDSHLPAASINWFTAPPLILTPITWAAPLAPASATVSRPAVSARRRKIAPARRRARVSKGVVARVTGDPTSS